ncbi:MAG: hypothetical protein PHP85_06985 [Gallionella sp.]|nr:hypothetical protein [Gallionella sp.]
MSRTVFWIAFLSSLCMSVLLSRSMPHDTVSVFIVALAWTGTTALAWNRWVAPDVSWLGRMAAGFGAAVLSVYVWQTRTDIFTIDSPCDNRVGTFWPLIFVWLACGALAGYALFGKRPEIGEITRPGLRPAIWWLLFIGWTAGYAYVFVNNITMDIFLESMRMAGILGGSIALFFGGIFGLAMLFSLPSRRRQKQAAADFERISDAERQEILDLIDHHSRQGEYILLYRPVKTGDTIARVGGDPVALPGETWPANDNGSPAVFMMQLPLTAPRLPPPWQNRIVVVFLFEHSLLVRSYFSPDLITLHNPAGERVVARQALQELAIPYLPVSENDEEDESGGWDTAQLLSQIPELHARLGQISKYPAYVLNMIIEGDAQLSVEDAILAGGDPMLIQGAHDPLCPVCQEPMRFLFQFGDVTEDFKLGDCGVGYIYGCDNHPTLCEGFVDCS